MTILKDVEDKQALLRKAAEAFFEMPAQDIPIELYGAFMGGYAQAMEDAKDTLDFAAKRVMQ